MSKKILYIFISLLILLWAPLTKAGCKGNYCNQSYANNQYQYDTVFGDWYGVRNMDYSNNNFAAWSGSNNNQTQYNPFGDWYGVNNNQTQNNPFGDWYGVNNSGGALSSIQNPYSGTNINYGNSGSVNEVNTSDSQPVYYSNPNSYQSISPIAYNNNNGKNYSSNNGNNGSNGNNNFRPYFIAPNTGVRATAPFVFAGLLTAAYFLVRNRKWIFN